MRKLLQHPNGDKKTAAEHTGGERKRGTSDRWKSGRWFIDSWMSLLRRQLGVRKKLRPVSPEVLNYLPSNDNITPSLTPKSWVNV